MNKYLAGSGAGFVATAPMTAVMMLIHRQLPSQEISLLPPEHVTTEIVQRCGVQLDEDAIEQRILNWLAHFGFGAVAGALYTPVTDRVEAPPALKGAAFGLMVWAVSYFGWLPALSILNQPKEQPARPNLMMIVAHLMWGACLGVLTEHWKD